jgi:hypothetical protein
MSRIVIVVLIVFSGYYEKWDISGNIFERSSSDVKIFSHMNDHITLRNGKRKNDSYI